MKNLFLAFILCFSLLASCGKKENKQSPRCLHDHSVFAEACVKAIGDEGHFAAFKKDPYLTLLWENHTREEGAQYLGKIIERFPALVEKFEAFREVDRIGSPRTYLYGESGVFSPSTLRLIALTGDLEEKVGSDQLSVIQIGAGFGSWCKILHDVHRFKSYTIVDLPEQLALAKKCLDAMGVDQVALLTPEELPKGAQYDLCISDLSFSEFDPRLQEIFLERAVFRSSRGYIFGHEFPKHYGLAPMNLDKLKERLRKMEMPVKVETSSSNYSIYWR